MSDRDEKNRARERTFDELGVVFKSQSANTGFRAGFTDGYNRGYDDGYDAGREQHWVPVADGSKLLPQNGRCWIQFDTGVIELWNFLPRGDWTSGRRVVAYMPLQRPEPYKEQV